MKLSLVKKRKTEDLVENRIALFVFTIFKNAYGSSSRMVGCKYVS